MKKILLLIIIGLFISCSVDYETKRMLSGVNELIDDGHPDSALTILKKYEKEKADWSKKERMHYELIKLKAENKADVVFSSDSVITQVADYYKSHGTANEQMLAYYLLGRVYSDMGEAPMALQAYYDAIEKADTLSSDCNYKTLTPVYGQMSQLFHQQNLPHDEIWALHHYIACTKKWGNEIDVVIAKSQLIRPYYLLGEKDTVLHIINETHQSLKHLGSTQRAAEALAPSIYIYIERNQLPKAKQIMDIFENESGLIDKNGIIAKGREHYYATKGFYELSINEIDSAEMYFRRVLHYGNLSDGYRGLLSVYRKKNDIDSVVLFSQRYEAAQDSLHNKMQIDAVHQMSALYNYARSQKEAEHEREKAQKTLILLGFIIFVTIVLSIVIIFIIWFYRKNQKEKQDKIAKLEESLENAKVQRSAVQEELRKLKEKDYEGIIAIKEEQEAELTKTIDRLQTENEKYKNRVNNQEKDDLDGFLNSAIAQLFIKKAVGKAERPKPTEAEWKLLISQFSKDIPVTFKSFGIGKSLSQLEQRVCILLILDISEKTISYMTDSVASTVSNAKARANEKLYGKKDAYSLKTNLTHTLRRS